MQKQSNLSLNDSAKAWSNIYSSGNQRRDVYPDHNFVRTLYYMNKDYWADGRNKKVLDIGFGKAYNLAYLGNIGYELHGTEVSEEAIQSGKNHLSSLNLESNLELVNDTLNYPDNFFDLIVCWGTLHFLGTQEAVDNLLKEVKRTLKNHSYFLSSLIRPDNSQIVFSNEVKKNEFVIGEKWPFDARRGSRIFCLPNEEAIKKLIGTYFTSVQVGSFGSDIPNGWANWHYCFFCKKVDF